MDDEHFLSRLDRLDAAQVEDALALYYDPRLVQAILAHTKERGHEDRIAISMDDPREGPFIIVTHSGSFVTALGRGMGVAGVPVVARSVWDAARREQERVREAFARAREVSGREITAMSSKLLTRGPWVSREVMSAMIDLAKLVPGPFLVRWAEALAGLEKRLEVVRTRDRWHRLGDDFFDRAGRVLWAASHYGVIVGASSVKELPEDDPARRALGALTPSFYTSRIGVLGPLVRGLWAVGKLGPAFFADCKYRFRESAGRVGPMDAALGLAAIGARFRKYRGEAKKVLTIAERPGETRAEARRRAWGRIAGVALEFPREPFRARLLDRGRTRWASATSRAEPGSPLHFPTPEDVPDELALPTFALGAYGFWQAPDHLELAGIEIPASCLLEVEELYVPQRWADLTARFDFVGTTQPAFQLLREARVPPRKPAAPPPPGRNEPCGCGSGKKYKRCCAA